MKKHFCFWLPALSMVPILALLAHADMQVVLQDAGGNRIFVKDASSVKKLEFNPFYLAFHTNSVAQIPFSHFAKMTFQPTSQAAINGAARRSQRTPSQSITGGNEAIVDISGKRLGRLPASGVYLVGIRNGTVGKKINLQRTHYNFPYHSSFR